MSDQSIYGVVAQFDGPGKLVEAAKAIRDKGYTNVEAYTPYPVKALDEILNKGWNPLPLIVLLAGFTGAATAWGMQYYIAAIDYPINVGGRPLYSWPSFIVILFELTVLFAAGATFFGTLALCGFPRPHFPLFNVRRFSAVSKDGFFLCIENTESLFDPSYVADMLRELEPIEIWEVDNS